MKKGVFCLKDLPRVMNRTPRIWEIGWMPDHLYLHRNRRIEAPHLCFTLRAELGAVKTLVNGRLRERRIRALMSGSSGTGRFIIRFKRSGMMNCILSMSRRCTANCFP